MTRARGDRTRFGGGLAAAVGERFLVPARTSPLASLWIAAHAVLAFPYAVMGSARRYRADVEGTQVRALCVGREDPFRTLLTRLLAGRLHLEGAGRRYFLWRPRRFWPTEADLIAVDIHPWLAARFRAAGWLVCPEFVRWQGELSRMPPAKPSKSLDSDLVRITRGGYAPEEPAGSRRDWEEFKEGMFIPYAARRFGEEAWIPSSGYLRALRRKGTLLFLRKDGQRVAGVCMLRGGDEAWVAALGVRDGDLALMRSGAIAAAYALAIDWAKARGMRRIDFGRTSGFQLDGIARFKRKWGTSPVRDPLSRLIAIRVDPGQPALQRALEREPFLVETDGALREYPR
jgi:Acetyltransferase (GNAT) domain